MITKWTEWLDLEIDHIIPVENNAMSGTGRNNRLQDWREQYFKGNLQLLCKDHNLDKREFKKLDKKNGGMKMVDELSFEGTMESVEPKTSEVTGKEYAFVKCNESEMLFSVFDTKIIEKLNGKKGKRIEIKYRKSVDGKYNNITEVFVMGENKETLAELIKQTDEMASQVMLKMDSVMNNLNRMRVLLPK
jgi:hypothetical protein